jgi:hypothetical protein
MPLKLPQISVLSVWLRSWRGAQRGSGPGPRPSDLAPGSHARLGPGCPARRRCSRRLPQRPLLRRPARPSSAAWSRTGGPDSGIGTQDHHPMPQGTCRWQSSTQSTTSIIVSARLRRSRRVPVTPAHQRDPSDAGARDWAEAGRNAELRASSSGVTGIPSAGGEIQPAGRWFLSPHRLDRAARSRPTHIHQLTPRPGLRNHEKRVEDARVRSSLQAGGGNRRPGRS